MKLNTAHLKVTGEFGLIVRRHALFERNVSYDVLLQAMAVEKPLDITDELISFGPHFGQEALDALTRGLIKLGLEYFDDFYEFSITHPAWCEFLVAPREVELERKHA